MIDLNAALKGVNDLIQQFPVEVRAELNKLNQDALKIAVSDKSSEQKQAELEFLHKSFEIRNKDGFKANT